MMRSQRTSTNYLRLALLACVLIACIQTASPQNSADDEKPWFDSFVRWATPLPPESFNSRGKIEQMYRQKLAAEGLTPSRVEQRWSSILKQQGGNEGWSTLFLNKRYSAGWYEGTPPSKYLVEFAKGRVAGKVLDCGTGAGRNAVLLASLGWDVTGIDISDVALERANALADKAGVKIRYFLSSYREFNWGKDGWDLIVNIDSWDGEGRTASTFAAAPLREALKPGGLLYIESHLPALTSSDQTLVKAFSGLKVVKYELSVDPDWTGASNKMVMFIAQRPTHQ